MQRVLIATTNRDKFKVVTRIFKNTIFPESEYEISCLTSDMILPEEKETGTNVERARQKALNAYNAVIIKGRVEPNIREYISKILYENYLEDGEEYAFLRAYCIIDKDKNIYETNLSIPEIYHPLKKDYKLEDHTYPLSQVSYPIGHDKPICDFSDKEATEYYLKYVKDGIMGLNIKKH